MTTKHTDKTAAELVGQKKAEVKDEVATDLAKDAVRQEARASTGTESDAEPTAASRYLGSDEIMLWAPLLEMGVDAFEERVAEKHDHVIPEEKVYGLLALERNGQNRTPYVKAMMKRLNLKREELPGGGPDYTNDVTPVTKL